MLDRVREENFNEQVVCEKALSTRKKLHYDNFCVVSFERLFSPFFLFIMNLNVCCALIFMIEKRQNPLTVKSPQMRITDHSLSLTHSLTLCSMANF
jgi:hypothetical protein